MPPAPLPLTVAFALEFPIAYGGGVSVLVRTLLEELAPSFQLVLISPDAAETVADCGVMPLLKRHIHWPAGRMTGSRARDLAAQMVESGVRLAHFHFGGTHGWGNRIPGNSGGPVLQEGKVVGVAFQGFSGDVAQNVGYMIPTPVIRHFLQDIEDGKYDRYMDLSIAIFNTLNPAMRRALGLADDDRGVLVTNVSSAGVSAGVLKIGDVILSIDGHPVSSDGSVDLDGERVLMAEVAERKFLGDTVPLSVLRDRKPIDLTLKFQSAFPYTLQASAYDIQPTYVVFGGLLFQPLSRNLMAAYRFENPRIEYFFDNFITKELFKDHPEVVVLSGILPDSINTYANEFRESIVSEVNDRKIRTLRDLADAFSQKPDFFVVKFLGNSRPLVLERAAIEAAQERIKSRYNVLAEQNLEESPAAAPAS